MDALQKTQAKKQWQKPELVVLVRSKPEEMVLSNCKTTKGGTNAGTFATSCLTSNGSKCVTNCANTTTS